MIMNRHPWTLLTVTGLLALAACSSGDDAEAEIVGVSDVGTTVASATTAAEDGGDEDGSNGQTTPATVPTTTPVESSAAVTAPSTSEPDSTSVGTTAPGADAPTPATEAGETIPVRSISGVLGDVMAELSVAGEVDVYEFDVVPGQSFAIEQLGGCTFINGDNLWLEVVGGGVNTTTFFDVQELEKSRDCDEVDRFDVDEAGTVTLTMRHRDETATGPYAFRIVDVTDGPVIPLAYGDVVEPGSPTAGSGVIEGIGRRDLYSLEVRSGQALAIEQLGGCAIERGDDLWMDVVGGGVDSVAFFEEQDLERSRDCDEVDRFEFDEDGLVIFVVRDGDDVATGPYSFRLRDVTDAPTIPLTSGDVVGPDVPVAGAGRLDQVGETDVYSIEVMSGQTLVIEQLGDCILDGDDEVWLRVGGAGLDTFSNFSAQDLRQEDDCVDVNEYDVEEDGIVILRMLNSDHVVTGTYNFRVSTR